MQPISAIFACAVAIAYGAVTGSFVGLIADRWPRGEPIGLDRSRCRGCGTQLGWRELVPIASFLWQRGRCRHCGVKVPRGLFLVELAGVAIALLALWAGHDEAGLLSVVALGALGFTLLLVVLLDAQDYRLPDRLTIPLTVIGIASGFLFNGPPMLERFAGAIVGFAVLEGGRHIYHRWRGTERASSSDAKLMAAIGAWFGVSALPGVVVVAALLIVAASLLAATRGVEGGGRLPFARALAGAGIAAIGFI